MTIAQHKKYLRVTALVIGAFGPVFFFGTMPSLSNAASFSLDIISWPIDGAQNYADKTTRFLSALTGGFLFGWGICIWGLQRWVYDLAPEGVRKSVVVGVLAWFFLDSLGSITSGNAANALTNCLVLVIAIGPLYKPATLQ